MPDALLSTRPVPPRERLIVAVDVPGFDDAIALVDRLGDAVEFYKLGLELSMSGRYFELVEALGARGKKVFADLKLYDIPATVGAAVRQLAKRGVDFVTVHAGGDAILEAACAERGPLAILAVTVLTSLDERDFADLGTTRTVEEIALHRARRAVEIGCDGVVASPLEARPLRQALGRDFLIVTPGIRPAARADDQKRVASPRAALEAGADYLVVGRPIRDAADPRAAAEEIQATIAGLFA